MPIYEYECSKCHHRLDLMQKMSDPPAQHCPQCSEDSLVRLVSATAFQLKGEGWYATDFKNKKSPTKQPDATQEAKETSTKALDKPSTDKPVQTSSSTKKKQEGE